MLHRGSSLEYRPLSLQMKLFLFTYRKNQGKRGFNLVEATLSLGILSFGFLALIPLLALGSAHAHQAHDKRTTIQIAETLIEAAKQGTLTSGTSYLDAQGNSCTANQSIYTVETAFQSLAGTPTSAGVASPTRLTLRVTPSGAPDRARIYAVIFSAPN